VDNVKGWEGEELPLEVQAIILMRKYQQSLDVVLRNVARLHKECRDLLEGCDGPQIINKLQEDPFFKRVLMRFIDGCDEYGDEVFRKNIHQLGLEAQEELIDNLIYVAVLLWVKDDDASLPDGMLEAVDEEE
jgi:hypothetical protein